jgi:hypothetical protein
VSLLENVLSEFLEVEDTSPSVSGKTPLVLRVFLIVALSATLSRADMLIWDR